MLKSPHRTIALLLLLATLPIWLFTYLPMTDLPEHMLIAKILVSFSNPQLAYGDYFTRHIPWNPYSSYFWFAALIGPALGVQAATKLYITVTFILSIVSVGFWLRTVAPERAPNVIATIPLLYGVFFYIGMINFLFSIPFLFLALALAWNVANSKASAGHVAALAASLLAIWFSHPVSFALAMALLGSQAFLLFKGRNLRPLVIASTPTAVVIAAYAYSAAAQDVSAFTWTYDPLLMRISALLAPFGAFKDVVGNQWVVQWDVAAYWSVFAVCIGAAVILGKGKEELSAPRGVVLAAAVLIAATLILPTFIAAERLPVAMRAAYPAAFALIALAPAGWHRHRTLRYIVTIACGAALVAAGFRISKFQPEMRNLEQALSVVPPRQRVQPVITEPHTNEYRTYPLLHAAAWYNQWKGGFSPYLFTKQAHFPVRERGTKIQDVPGEWNAAAFTYDADHAGTDYFLVRSKDSRILADLSQHLPLASQAGEWRVYGPNSRNE